MLNDVERGKYLNSEIAQSRLGVIRGLSRKDWLGTLVSLEQIHTILSKHLPVDEVESLNDQQIAFSWVALGQVGKLIGGILKVFIEDKMRIAQEDVDYPLFVDSLLYLVGKIMLFPAVKQLINMEMLPITEVSDVENNLPTLTAAFGERGLQADIQAKFLALGTRALSQAEIFSVANATINSLRRFLISRRIESEE